MVGIISLWLKNISSFITLFIQSSCECLGLLGGTGLLSVNKSGRTVPTVLCRSRGSVPSQNRACCFCKSGLPLNEATQHNYYTLFPPPRLTEAPQLQGARCWASWPPFSGALGSACLSSNHSWAFSNGLPVKAARVQACEGLAELGSPVTLKLVFQFILSGALVCPLSYLQQVSASKKQSSGLVLGSWVMASAERINIFVIVDVVVVFWMLGFF